MFGNGRPTYPCSIADQTDEGHEEAIAWVFERLEPGQRVTMWVPLKSTLGANDYVEALNADPRVVTFTKRDARNMRADGPVLALYAHADDLSGITGAPGITALCVVQWGEELRTWASEVGAEVVYEHEFPADSNWQPSPAPTPLQPEIVDALNSMTLLINHNNTIKAGYEKRIVVQKLLELRQSGIHLPPQEMKEWAAANGWRRDNPKHLASLCEQINSGSTPRVR